MRGSKRDRRSPEEMEKKKAFSDTMWKYEQHGSSDPADDPDYEQFKYDSERKAASGKIPMEELYREMNESSKGRSGNMEEENTMDEFPGSSLHREDRSKDDEIKGKSVRQYRLRVTIVLFMDIACIVLSYFLGLLVRFDMHFHNIPAEYFRSTIWGLPWIVISYLIVYRIFNLYRSIWRYASINEAYHIVLAYVTLAVVTCAECIAFIRLGHRIPVGVMLIAYTLTLISCLMIRFGYRMVRYLMQKHIRRRGLKTQINVLMIGAGQAAKELINDFRLGRHMDYRVMAFVDDNPTKKGRYLEGICIEGDRYDIPALVEKYDIKLIIFAIPSASSQDRADILNICKDTGCQLKIIPGLFQIVNGEVNVSHLRDVQIEDLLGRDEIRINLEKIKKTIEGKVVMVTGGGGSIGSELCRQVASAHPKQLIIFDIYENNAYAIQQELHQEYGDSLNLVTLIGSVRNTSRVNSVIKTYRPEIIYHAAAHKHVPLMENSPCEAVKNNVMGTYKLAKAAAEMGVKRFLLISTDKAVNPTSLMGATKRICEMIVQMMNRRYPDTIFMAVRFGNVLGSNGSVIPLFKEQIAHGGPVTVTDKRIIRYFMTIPEAVSLILEAAYYAKGGEIFVLDMGEPVRIDDMARNLIKLSGYQPDVDIKIVYTGLRPGEKLYEELLMDEEGMKDTPNKLIHIGYPIAMDDDLFLDQIDMLDKLSKDETAPMDMKKAVSFVVPTYHPDLAHTDQAQGA